MNQLKPLVFAILKDENELYKIEKMLSPQYAVMHTTNPEAGLEIYRAVYPAIRVVLLDLEYANQLQLLNQMRGISTAVEFIVLSEKITTQDAIDVMRAGANNLITKPFEKKTLYNAINAALNTEDEIQRIELNFLDAFLDKMDSKLNAMRNLLAAPQAQSNPISDEQLAVLFDDLKMSDFELDKATILKIIKTIKKVLIPSFTPKILIIEDEQSLRDYLSEKLPDTYDIIEAENGYIALNLAKSEPRLDLIIIDIGLPDIKGIDLIPELLKSHPKAGIIMLTAFKDMESIVASFKNEAYEYITKPFKLNQLIEKINLTLEKTRLHEEMNLIEKIHLLSLIPEQKKISLLNKIATRKKDAQKQLLMRDVYKFFPDLKKSKISDTNKVPANMIDDGIGFLIDALKEQCHSCH